MNPIEYLYSIGVSHELINNFEKIVSDKQHNENPYQLLDELTPIFTQSNQHVYKYVRKNRIECIDINFTLFSRPFYLRCLCMIE